MIFITLISVAITSVPILQEFHFCIQNASKIMKNMNSIKNTKIHNGP